MRLRKGKFKEKVHRCRKPFNWFRRRFDLYSQWKCKCGREWTYLPRRNDLNKWMED